MQQQWTPVKSLDHLFSEEMATQLGKELEVRSMARHKARQLEFDVMTKVAELQGAAMHKSIEEDTLKGLHTGVAAEAEAFLKGAETPPSITPDPVVQHFPIIPSPHSCVGAGGPFNSWGGSQWAGLGEATLRLDPGNPRMIGARCVYLGGGAGHVWGGTGSWFRASRSGVARLRISLATSGRSIVAVTLPPFGYAHSHIRFWGSAWGAAEGRWVDRGGFGTDLFTGTYYGSRVYDHDSTFLSGSFDTVGGGFYYCAAGFDVWSGGGGFATAGSSFWTLVSSLIMCEP